MEQIQTADEFTQKVLQSDKPVVVDFFTEWCGPCRALAPILEEISKERDDVKIIKVDAGNFDELAQQYNVTAFPTLIYFKDGNAVANLMGLRPKNALIEWISNQ